MAVPLQTPSFAGSYWLGATATVMVTALRDRVAFAQPTRTPLPVDIDSSHVGRFPPLTWPRSGGALELPRALLNIGKRALPNDVKRPSRFEQQRGCLFPFRSEQQAR